MGSRNTINATEVMDLIKHQAFRCAISGRDLTPETASLDHIVPLGAGGEHSLANVWAVDHQVNTAKGTLSLEDFMSICRDVAAHQRKVREQGAGPPAEYASGEAPPDQQQ